ncbi:MAG: hypothetical protein WAP51_02730 [Candidatus Sungiibacteriota bacterium]
MEQPAPKEKSPLEAFRQEMRELKEAEMKKKEEWESRGHAGAAYDPHFGDIEPGLLTDKDRVIWHKVKNQTLTREELEQYRQELAEEFKTASPEEKKSRGTFQAMAVNKAAFIIKRELEKLNRAKKEK